ncbi:MAG TPA: MBL fold metallo-hydrolase [Acidimicrobiales bacterium]|nr:MBL fold metallo-hydrolase [Acidimicrobiales bacterium]
MDASPDIVEVAPGILRLQLPIDFTGLGHVNTYALEDTKGFTLIDPGLPGEESWKMLRHRMDAAGIPLERVHTIVVTHSHPDHFGGAGLLAEKSGGAIVASERFRTFFDAVDLNERELEDADSIDGDENPIPGIRLGGPSPWGGSTIGPPPEARERMLAHRAEGFKWFKVPRPTHGVADCDQVSLGGRDWVGLFTPGHTDDHLCLYDEENGVLLSGDQVLPTITPHISGLIPGDSLKMYTDSLDRLSALPHVSIVLPAHGQPFHDLAGRASQIKRHHDERLARLLEICDAAGWANVINLSHELFAPRSWGSMAEEETFAHLERLLATGALQRREEAGVLLYRP